MSKGTILLVDDDEFVTEIFAKEIENVGYTVVTESNGENALYRFFSSKHEFILILTDFNMPKMNGVELAIKIKEYNEDVPIILWSAYPDGIDLGIQLEFGLKINEKLFNREYILNLIEKNIIY